MTERPLRVAYLMRYLPAPSETFVLDEAVALEAAGAMVRVWALDHVARAVRHARHESIYARARFAPRPSSPRAMIAGLMMGEGPAQVAVRGVWGTAGRTRDLRRVAWLARTFRARNIDVIRVHHASETARYAVAAGTMAGIPVSVAVHARDMFVPVEDFPWILGTSSLVTTITPYHRDRLLRTGLPSELVELLPCPVALPSRIAEPPEPGSALRLLAVGRLVPKKGHDLLIAACAQLSQEGTPIELSIVGDGAEGLTLRHLAGQVRRQCGGRLSIEMPGAMPVERIESLLETGRVHAATLACREAEDGDRDGVPVTLMEAQAWGLPVVTTAMPGFEYELLEGGGATLVSTILRSGRLEPNPAQLIRALAELYRDPAARQRQAEAARRTAEKRVTPEEVGRRLLTMLTALASG